eukprot:s2934_g8.t2
MHYLLANLTDDAARLIVRLNEPGNGFETWRQLHERFALPSRAKGVSLLSQLLEHQVRDAHFEADLTAFIVLKNKHERATNTALSDDLLVTLMMNKTASATLEIASEHPEDIRSGALWQIEEGSEWNEDEDGTDWNEQQTGENGENADWSDYQGALYDDSAWTEDDWYADWWYDDGYDWSSDWSWYEDSSWQASHWATEAPQLALPAPQQPIVTQSPAAAQVAHWHQAQQQQTAAAVIAGPPGLVASDQIANDSLIASSSSSSRTGQGRVAVHLLFEWVQKS